jgi:sec-independent protein translocase protein TatB
MSISHLVVIAVIALIVLGPEKLPQVARMAGKFMAEFRRITGDFRSTIETEMREMEREVALKEMRQKFPEHVHYDLQQTPEPVLAPQEPAALPPAEAHSANAAETEAATTPGKQSDGEPHPA